MFFHLSPTPKWTQFWNMRYNFIMHLVDNLRIFHLDDILSVFIKIVIQTEPSQVFFPFLLGRPITKEIMVKLFYRVVTCKFPRPVCKYNWWENRLNNHCKIAFVEVVNEGVGSGGKSSDNVAFRRDVVSVGRNGPSKKYISYASNYLHYKNILIGDQKMGI